MKIVRRFATALQLFAICLGISLKHNVNIRRPISSGRYIGNRPDIIKQVFGNYWAWNLTKNSNRWVASHPPPPNHSTINKKIISKFYANWIKVVLVWLQEVARILGHKKVIRRLQAQCDWGGFTDHREKNSLSSWQWILNKVSWPTDSLRAQLG